MEIKQKFDYVDGTFNTETDKLVCVPSSKYMSVDLALKSSGGGMNIGFSRIRLHSKDLYVDAKEVFESASNLCEEIVKRFNFFIDHPEYLEKLDETK